MTRRIIQVHGSEISVSQESRFQTEQFLEDAVAAHPEALPSEDFGLGPLVRLGQQVDFGAGPIDLLAADPQGRLVIIEFKRGSENPDVRKVVAQLLDYGASLWRLSYDDIERRCAAEGASVLGYLADRAAEQYARLDAAFDPEAFNPEAFKVGIEHALDSGDFAFLYVGRDLDDRTRRIMTYLTEGPQMSFFGVEVDYYAPGTDGDAVLVPRAAFVPTWIVPRLPTMAFRALVERMDDVARELGLVVKSGRTGRNYQPAAAEAGANYTSGIGIYSSGRGVEFNLGVFRDLGDDASADDLLRRLRDVSGQDVRAPGWPAVPCETLIPNWSRTRTELIEPYFRARARLAQASPTQHG
jgi:hypothetical protein